MQKRCHVRRRRKCPGAIPAKESKGFSVKAFRAATTADGHSGTVGCREKKDRTKIDRLATNGTKTGVHSVKVIVTERAFFCATSLCACNVMKTGTPLKKTACC